MDLLAQATAGGGASDVLPASLDDSAVTFKNGLNERLEIGSLVRVGADISGADQL